MIEQSKIQQRFRQAPTTEGSQVLSATFDLRVGAAGEPTAEVAMKDALSDAVNSTTDLSRSETELRDLLATSIAEAIADGHSGLAVLWPLGRDAPEVAASPHAYRNRVDIGPRPWLFEIERHAALHRASVLAIRVDRSEARFLRLSGDGAVSVEQLAGDAYSLRSPGGRTATQGRGGSAGQPAGGHGKTRIESSAEEHREAWARQVADHAAEATDLDVLLLAGVDEMRSRVAAHLPDHLAERVVELNQIDDSDGDTELTAQATEWACTAHREQARALAARATAGDPLLIADLEQIEQACREGRVGSLIVNDNTVSHYGDASDTRLHPALADEKRIELLVGLAVEQSATTWFVDDEQLLDAGSVAAGLRWLGTSPRNGDLESE